MKNFHNIEKLPGKSHYTGYAGGLVFHINRVDGKWRAHCPNNGGGAGEIFYRRTMAEVSAKLDERAAIHAKVPPTKFRDLAIGERFTFDNGVSTFHATCTKVSARKYTWQYADLQRSSTVGTVNVTVKRETK